ncbi:hypothetical protein BGZ51_005891 [Haplosporangium sp. Z 767]|nr:hypothetical protein BGZ51_005891 [Haplosporangium sp. Z 767]KAF9184986.1 hypothetical protein BGZ50_003357 [Haplosporangium sp. Z 11]
MSMLSRPHPLRKRNRDHSQSSIPSTFSTSTVTLTALPSCAARLPVPDADLVSPPYSPLSYTPKVISPPSIPSSSPAPAPALVQPSSSSVTAALETKATATNSMSTAIVNPEKPSSINPLDIPEILTRVGQFIPLWSQYKLGYCARFYPQILARATQVSRHWHNVLTPLLWYFFDDSQHIMMTSVPRHIILKNAHWIRVLHQRHVTSTSFYPSPVARTIFDNVGQSSGFFDGCCRNLIQLTISPWIAGIEDLLRLNKRLEKFSWQAHAKFPTVPKSIYDAMAGIDSGGYLLPGGGLTRLRELEFVGCQLDPLLLFPVLGNHLPKLRIVAFQDVIFMSKPMVPNATEPGTTSTLAPTGAGSGSEAEGETELRTKHNLDKLFAFPQIHELRFGKGIRKVGTGEWLVDFVLCCPNLERLILESDDQHWVLDRDSILNGMHSNFSRLLTNLEYGCRKLRNIEYRSNITFGKGAIVLSDIHNSRLADCISVASASGIPEFCDNSMAHNRSSDNNKSALLNDISERDLDQDPIPPVSFKADIYALGSMVTSSLCRLSPVLEVVSLRLHSFEYVADLRSNTTNALKILTSCPNLMHFSLEYYALGSVQAPLMQPKTILTLFSRDWVCSGLKTLVLNGIKREVNLEFEEDRKTSETRRSDRRMALRMPVHVNYVPVKMKDLLAIARLDSCYFVTRIYSSGRRDMIEDMEMLQQKMFRQLALLKNLKELRFNEETFCDFSKLADFAKQ